MVVIAVEADAVTVTYTDVHLVRAKFFTGLFRNLPVEWSGLDRKSAEGLGDDGAFYLVTGRFHGRRRQGARRFSRGSRRFARFPDRLEQSAQGATPWISKADAVRVLDWAARHRFGHRGFLELGGGELVAAAVHHATPTRIGFGERLDRALGRDAAIDFLKTVLRICAEALLEGGSVRLARDRIEADLVRHLQRLDGLLLAIVVRQAGLAREIAAGIAQFIAEQQAGRPFDRAALAARARRIEEKADKIAIEARNEIARFDADASIELLVNRAEQAIDELEQAAFISSLVPDAIAPDLLGPLAALCAAAVEGAEAAATGAACAADVPEGHNIDAEDALAAVGRLIEAEHKADAAERAVTKTVLGGDFDLKSGLSVLELARAVERSTDQLAGFGHLLRARVLADLVNVKKAGSRADRTYRQWIDRAAFRRNYRRQGRQPSAYGCARSAGAAGLCAAGRGFARPSLPAIRKLSKNYSTALPRASSFLKAPPASNSAAAVPRSWCRCAPAPPARCPACWIPCSMSAAPRPRCMVSCA